MVTAEEYLLKALEEAVQMELDSRVFYLQAALKVKSPEVRETLEFLAVAENYHIDKLNEIYESLKADPAWTEDLAAFEPVCREPAAWARAGEGRKRPYRYDLEALETAIKMEESAIRHYGALSVEARQPLARRFFADIELEERLHHKTIVDLRNFLVTAASVPPGPEADG